MSSHWDYVEQRIKDYDLNKPFAPENGEALKFAIGQTVVFTNDYGVEFRPTITGLYKRESDAGMYSAGYRYLVNSSSPWFPVKEQSLRLAAIKGVTYAA
jgi:hypothetical protein